MKRDKQEVIPVHSHEATIIIGKLFVKGVEIFDKRKVNMPLNERR